MLVGSNVFFKDIEGFNSKDIDKYIRLLINDVLMTF